MRRYHLPSGNVAELDDLAPSLDVVGRFAGEVACIRARLFDASGVARAVGDLPLRDLHTLRAVARRLGIVEDEVVAVDCKNCGHRFTVRPCSTLELGPYLDDELTDAVLDAPHPFDDAHVVDAPDLASFRLCDRTVCEAAPLHRLATQGRLVFDSRSATAFGVARLDDEGDSDRIAQRLNAMSDEAFDAIVRAFEVAHYPPRLAAPHACSECGAVEWIGTPVRRELGGDPEDPESSPRSVDTDFPSMDDFEALVRQVAPGVYAAAGVANVGLVVHEGPAHLDDAGTPLLGSYVPEDLHALPPTSSEVTLYYRTFASMWEDEGPYDVRAEIEETLAHELEHHLGHVAGIDPLDEDERAELGEEYVGRVGLGEARRRAARSLGSELAQFVRGTWWLWLIVGVVTALAVARP